MESDLCQFGTGKQETKTCPMIYIHWPGYYPTKESYHLAVKNLCPNYDFRLLTMECKACGKAIRLSKMSTEGVSHVLEHQQRGERIVQKAGETNI